MKKKKKYSRKIRNSKTQGVFKDSLSYIKESRNQIYFIIALFFLSALVGFVFPGEFEFFDSLLSEISTEIKGLGFFEMVFFIFRNNVTSAFLGLMLGAVLGIFPMFNALMNGALAGYVISRASEVGGLGVIWLLVPHGIFELPAIFIALGLGVKFGMFFFAKNWKREFHRRFNNSWKAFLTVILPLLAIAALIESILILS